MRTIRQALYVNSLAQGRKPDEGESLEALATSFAYALDDIPTQHLGVCLQRAIRQQTGDFLLTAGAVNKQYQDMIPELQRDAQSHASEQERLLMAGEGSLGYMGIEEWKQRHNLPPVWKLGDPYPPESDLYNAPLPLTMYERFRCAICKDARWVKMYPDGPLYPKLIRCPDCL